MNIKRKITVLLTLIALLIYIVSPFNPVQQVVLADNGNTSTIGGVPVGDLKDEELKSKIQAAITEWTAQPITISGGGVDISVDPRSINFDIDSTLVQYENMVNKPWYAFWQADKKVNFPLSINGAEQIQQQIAEMPIWKADETFASLMGQATVLGSHEIEATIFDLVALDSERLALMLEDLPGGMSGVSSAATALNEVVLAPGDEFSFNEEILPVESSLNEITSNFIASMIYGAALQVNAQIIERHSQKQIPSYLEPGIEVAVNSAQNKDLRFINTLDQVMMLKVTQEEGRLKVEFYAPNESQAANVNVKTDRVIEPRTIIRYTNSLPIGSEVEEQVGEDGLRVTVSRVLANTNVEEVVSKDFYPPVHRIVLRSSRQPVVTEDETMNPDGTMNNGDDNSMNNDPNQNNDPNNNMGNSPDNNNSNNNPDNNWNNDSGTNPGNNWNNGNATNPGNNWNNNGGNNSGTNLNNSGNNTNNAGNSQNNSNNTNNGSASNNNTAGGSVNQNQTNQPQLDENGNEMPPAGYQYNKSGNLVKID